MLSLLISVTLLMFAILRTVVRCSITGWAEAITCYNKP